MNTKISVRGEVVAVDVTATDPTAVLSSLEPEMLGAAQQLGVPVPTIWNGHYRITTHNRTADEIVAEVNRVQDHHAKKSALLNIFAAGVGTPVLVGGVAYSWFDCLVRECGARDVELVLDVKDAAGKSPAPMPMRLYYPSCDAVPAFADIVALVEGAIAAAQTKVAAQAQTLADVRSKLGLGGA